MICFVVDNNIERQARVLFGAVTAKGWTDLVPMRLVSLSELGLPRSATDRDIWRQCQARGMLLLTANRASRGRDSLGAVLRDEASAGSLPVLTLADANRVHDRAYLDRCVSKIVDIALSLDRYLGAGRIYIP